MIRRKTGQGEFSWRDSIMAKLDYQMAKEQEERHDRIQETKKEVMGKLNGKHKDGNKKVDKKS